MSTPADRPRNQPETASWRGPGRVPYVPRVLLPGFAHRPGVHCGSTALADALRVRGLDITEAMAFGLGAGLGFFYLDSPVLSPHAHHPRAARGPLEETACDVLGAPVAIRTENDPALAWSAVRDAARPGHRPRPLHRPALPPVLEDLLPVQRPPRRAGRPRRGEGSGAPRRHRAGGAAGGRRSPIWSGPAPPTASRSASPAGSGWRSTPRARRSAGARPWATRSGASPGRCCSRQDGYAGVSGLERFAAEVPRWHELARDEADRAWCFRFAYQCIERRGTGGGNFRLLYARFLDEAARPPPRRGRPRAARPGWQGSPPAGLGWQTRSRISPDGPERGRSAEVAAQVRRAGEEPSAGTTRTWRPG